MTGADELREPNLPALRAEMAELEETYLHHPALRIAQQMEELERATNWYVRNAEECMDCIDRLGKDGLGFEIMTQSEVPTDGQLLAYVTELGRTWHNFVASANTFTDHMRHQFADQPDDLNSEYTRKRAELLAAHDVIKFIERSRNVLLHRGVFNTTLSWLFSDKKMPSFDVMCRTDILLNRYKSWWDAPSRRYIKARAPRLSLSEAINEHVEATLPLYEWYRRRFYEYHYSKFAEFESMTARLREIKEEISPGSTAPPEPDAHFQSPEEHATPPPARPPRAKNAARAASKRKRKKRKRGRGKP